MTQALPNTQRLLEIMAILRDPEKGCPWDKQQNFESIVPYTIEEVYEVADAIFHKEPEDIKEELGDLLFQVVFYAQLGKETSEFDFEEIASTIVDKLERRHPHIFGDETLGSTEDVAKRWDEIKRSEKQNKRDFKNISNTLLYDIPQGMTPLLKAEKIQKKCAKVGFDWSSIAPVICKVREELIEIEDELKADKLAQDKVEEEVGDLLFAVVNLSRHLKVNAESALIRANQKFTSRFMEVEKYLSERGTSVQEAKLEQMEAAWQSVKDAEAVKK